jgi:hypothetical protein
MGNLLSSYQIRVRSSLALAQKKDHVLTDSQSGQAITEYILLLAIVATSFILLSLGIGRMGVAQKLTQALVGPFAATYRYGHPKAKGFDDGGPSMHPMASGGNNFRIFIYEKK